ncbi:SIS domain-containing protein [Candidatus Pelagibacter sp.]|jgi:D-sedoheptulose 7-phosphate isomerase|nr:SIS domain-containing protein [Candidatus Pelagibacter sp.]
MNNHISNYFNLIPELVEKINKTQINKAVDLLSSVKKRKGRIFLLGVGGSAGNCSHAVNDFRKICEIESYTPTDNVSELTARINDDGWDSSFRNWLEISQLNSKDVLFIFSVGGGNQQKKVSVNLIKAIDYAKTKKSKILGIVGRDGGYTAKKGDAVIIIPTVDKKLITPYAESFQSVIWHCLVTHPKLQSKKMKW